MKNKSEHDSCPTTTPFFVELEILRNKSFSDSCPILVMERIFELSLAAREVFVPHAHEGANWITRVV